MVNGSRQPNFVLRQKVVAKYSKPQTSQKRTILATDKALPCPEGGREFSPCFGFGAFFVFFRTAVPNSGWRPAGHDLVEGFPGPVGKFRGHTLSGYRDVVRRARADNHGCDGRVAEPKTGRCLWQRGAEVLAYAGQGTSTCQDLFWGGARS